MKKTGTIHSMGKKGFIFSALALIMTSIIIFFLFTGQPNQSSSDTAVSATIRLNSAINDLEKDVVRGLYITSFRTIIAQDETVTSQGQFLNNSQSSFYEGMINGTIEGFNASTLDNATFTDWLLKTKEIMRSRGILFSYNITNITEFQTNYDYVSTSLEMNYTLSDYRKQRTFRRLINITVKIPVSGLDDPIYYIESLGRITSTINFTNNTNILYLINQSAYKTVYTNNNQSPDYLMRLEGNFSASPDGIESVVDGQKFLIQGITQYNGRSSIDAMYFSNRTETIVCINNTPSWFRLDTARLGDYANDTVVSC